ncbi:MAG: polysaccharide deacetylase family protein, partial [Endomicrobia bacterium]|nr:polysaccharide deacetylase family protein [Endomicrobiia bacterium]
TFFMLGSQVEKKPKLAKEVFEAGHEVQSHMYSHISFFKYEKEDKYEKMKDELLKAERIIEKNTGVKPYLVRFPYGYSKDDAKKVVSESGYKIINWTFGCDWDRKLTAEEMRKKYAGKIKGGAIFLMHDLNYNERLLSFLGDFIDEIKAQGYELVTVSELLDLKK